MKVRVFKKRANGIFEFIHIEANFPFYFFLEISSHCIHFISGKNRAFPACKFFKVLDFRG